MAQSDQVVQNATFPTVRADINDNLAAIFSQNSGVSAPTTTTAFMPWVDTSASPPIWKIRNASNSGWITVGTLDPAQFQIEGSAEALLPSQTGNAGKALLTDGAALLWGTITGSSFTKYETPGTFTWVKPSGGTTAIVLCWGGGGSGGRSDGGAGGGAGASCVIGFFKLTDLSSTETVTVGSGGASVSSNGNGNSGGDSSFGTHATGYGGKYGGTATFTPGGWVRSYSSGATPWDNGFVSADPLSQYDAPTLFHGASSQASGTDSDGGKAIFGGGAGGGCDTSGTAGGDGGISLFGGNGGAGASGSANAVAGQQPGGGGGGADDGISGAGGDGAVWVIVV